jgi:hypothetical protein
MIAQHKRRFGCYPASCNPEASLGLHVTIKSDEPDSPFYAFHILPPGERPEN